MKKKIIIITFSNGDVFHVDAYRIANERTEYYMKVDGITDRESKEWKEEFEQSMKPCELKDWIQNNMNWSDIVGYAKQQPRPSDVYNYSNNFCRADIQFDIQQ